MAGPIGPVGGAGSTAGVYGGAGIDENVPAVGLLCATPADSGAPPEGGKGNE